MGSHRSFSAAIAGAVFAALLFYPTAATAQFGGGRDRSRFRRFEGMGPPAVPATEAKPEEKKEEKPEEKKEGEAKPEEKKDEGPAPVQRPLMPERPADPAELEAKPADDGKISFSFNGQPWPAVLEWLADISNMSLEWEEAPAGYVNLTTHGRYSVDEVRDILNSYLLNKGFTVLRNGEVLIVVNLKKLDNSLVPRVRPEELDERGTYELVRSFFDLDWLVAEQAAEEIKPLLSPFGKATPLKATNRLDVLDTAGNLRRIRELLAEEQSGSGQQRLIREFPLQYTRAEEVLDTLQTLLGIEKQSAAGPVDPRQLMQAMMMAQQQGGGQQMPQMGKKESTVFLAVNARQNSILAQAPPDKMGIIEQAVKAVDVPQGRGKGFLADAQRVKVYRLSGLQPETLVKVLKELGSLDPTTKLEIDVKKNALVAYAPLADHLLITDLVERLDGTSRKFEVIQLRTLSAEYVAGSILTLMNGPDKQNDSGRSRYPYYFFDSGSQQQQDTADKFWVEADVERNRLLLKANDVELAEVKALLVKLGEIPADQRFGQTMRMVPAMPDADTLKALDRAKSLFESMSPNEVEIEIDPRSLEWLRRRPKPEAESDAPAGGRRRAPAAAPQGQPQRSSRGGRSAAVPERTSRFRLAQDVTVKEEEPETGRKQQSETPDEKPEAVAGETVEQDTETPNEQPENDDARESPADRLEAMDADEANTDPEPAAEGREEPPADDEAAPHNREKFPMDPADLPRRAHAPVKIQLGPQGLVISSSDTDALDRLEEILNSVMPPRTSYEIFTLKHTYAKDMVLLLKDIFRADIGKESNSKTEVFDMFWNGYSRGSSSQQTRNTLSRRRPLNFVADPVTNTVLVQGADAGQLAEIAELIERYDRAEPPNSESVRRTTRIPLRFAKAKEVADVIKDVYRDLLSPNDKALVGTQPPQQPGRGDRNSDGSLWTAMFSYLSDDPKAEIVPRFKGMLSVGVDERANGVIISAPQIILTEVLKLVEDLDRDARPARPVVRMLRVQNPGTAAQLQQAIAKSKAQAAPATEAGTNGTSRFGSGMTNGKTGSTAGGTGSSFAPR